MNSKTILKKIDKLRVILNNQILNNDSYENIYITSVKLDKLISIYYKYYDINEENEKLNYIV